MSGRQIFVLVVFGLLSLYGALVWRTAWTGELPRSIRQGGGWRERLRMALAASPPTGRLMPLLIVVIWTMYLMYICFVLGLDTVGRILLAVFVTEALLAVSVFLFRRPRSVIPPYARS